MSDRVRKAMRSIPDFPKPGILFRDISTILLDPDAFKETIDILEERYRDRDIDAIAAIEARGFIFGAVLADRIGTGLILIRKPGKLPAATVSTSYELEYGEASIEMHADAVRSGDRILLVDDLLATGGSAAAAAGLIEERGGTIEEIAVVIELTDLDGRSRLGSRSVFSIIAD